MPADRLLGTLLRSLQTYTEQQDTPRLLSTAASLLISLQNPLNITILTGQLLTAPALWHRPEGLQTCLRLMGVFHSAILTLLRREEEDAIDSQSQWYPTPTQGIPKDAWIRAVLKGADEKSPAWKHVMVISGLLLGVGQREDERLSPSIRDTLEQALVSSVNQALQEIRSGEEELAAHCVTLALNHTFGTISDFERSLIDYDMLLPVLIGSAFFSNEGLQGAYFLGAVDLDIVQLSDGKLNWRANSLSYHHVLGLSNRPLITALGPLSRLIAHAAENVRDSSLIQTMLGDLGGFTKALMTQWRQTRLSNVDIHDEGTALTEETRQTTMPQLWKLLKSSLFALTIVFRGVMGRLLGDRILASDAVAPDLACQVLYSLRSLYFITSRVGTNSFSQYTFVYLTCIDILGAYPCQADAFLRSIAPIEIDSIPSSPVDRILALYFLNTAEHFTLVVNPRTNEDVLVAAAVPYLSAGHAKHLMPLFEAAHSVVLAVLATPQNAETAAKHAPFYVDSLFSAFPDNLSPRQFRLAFKTLIRVAVPPSSLSVSHPMLPAVLLELVHHRALNAPTVPLQQPIASPLVDNQEILPPLSEQAILTLTLLDALPFLPLHLLEEWLPLSAQLVNTIQAGQMKHVCQLRFWEVLVNGEMDPERALLSVSWWTTRGGQEMVMGREADHLVMSGGRGGGEPAAPKI